MAGTCVNNLVRELEASGQKQLATRIAHAVEHDNHIENHRGEFVIPDCDYCLAEIDDKMIDPLYDGEPIQEKLRLRERF